MRGAATGGRSRGTRRGPAPTPSRGARRSRPPARRSSSRRGRRRWRPRTRPARARARPRLPRRRDRRRPMPELRSAVGQLQSPLAAKDAPHEGPLADLRMGPVDGPGAKHCHAASVVEGRLHRHVVVPARASWVRATAQRCRLIQRQRLTGQRDGAAAVTETRLDAVLIDVQRADRDDVPGACAGRA